MFVPITPIPKPRTTQRDRWAKRPIVVRYYDFCDELRLKYQKPLPASLSLIFYIPMPKSWSNKKKSTMLGKPHQQRPDIDNLVKAVLDALCEDDSFVWNIEACKLWSDKAGIDIEDFNG